MKNKIIQFKIKENKLAWIATGLMFLVVFVFPQKAQAAFPVISATGSSAITTISATITWTTDIDANSFVDYGLTTNYDNTRGNASSYVKGHSITINNLDPNISYKFRVRSTDSNGDQTIDDNGGIGFSFTTAAAPVISNVRLAEVTNTYATITWETDIASYSYVAYGSTSDYGQLIGDEETPTTSHSMTIAGLSAGTVKHYMPRVKDIYGNFTFYGIDSTFTTGAPYLVSFSSSSPSGSYGPGDEINITANYVDSASNNLGASSTATVLLDTGVEVVLNTVGTNTLSGTYTVGATGSGENSVDLRVSSLISQNVCDSNNYCHTGITMPSGNIHLVSDILVDTVAPIFSGVSPGVSSFMNSLSANSDISYTLSETLNSASIVITRTGGAADPTPSHTCVLIGTALNSGAHNNFDTTNCQGGEVSLVDGTVYTFSFSGADISGNTANQIDRTGVTFDTSAPQLVSFTSTSPDNIYGPGSAINITATYGASEDLADGSNITVTLDSGKEMTLSAIVSGNKLSGSYVVGATGSGENSSDLRVATIGNQSAIDMAGNEQLGTSLPVTNISDGSAIIIDTIAPDQPSVVQFMTDPINNANKNNVTLRVSGEVGATIHYSIDDVGNTFTNPVAGNSDIIEPDGSTDITGISVAGLDDGTLTATVTLVDIAQNVSVSGNDTVSKDTTGPTFSVQYYSDFDLLNSLGDNPELKAGTYYLKISANEALNGAPTISIDAEGTGNDVVSLPTTLISNNDYRYSRDIIYDASASGTSLENIKLTGTDVLSNTSTDVNPTDEASRAAYTDTIKPVIISGLVSPDNAKAGVVNVSLTFDNPMDQSVSLTATIEKNDTNNLPVTGGYTDSTHWSGTINVVSGDANGTATLKISGAKDLAGNTMDDNNNVDTFIIDTVIPTFVINDGVSGSSAKTDTINLTVSDVGGTGVASQFYGFSLNNICDENDTINNSFSSGINFNITGDHSDYLCVAATDNANNVAYVNVGQLNVDNATPTVSNISSNHADGSFKAGETIDIDVTFSENVTSTGDVTVTLETGTTDQSCSFPVNNSNFGTCDYVVQAGDTSSDLNVQAITGTINDQALNPMTNFVPATNLNQNKNIVIDTTAPTVNITYPTAGVRAGDGAKITFSDDEIVNPECSIDNLNWVSCSSGSTALSSLTGWDALGDGAFNLYLRDIDPALNAGTNSQTGVIKDNSSPTVSNISSNHADGSFKAGETIDIDVTFSENVTSTGDVTVTLETGTTDQSCSFPVNNSNFGTCDYVVQAGDTSSDLNVQAITGTINDQALNPMTNFVPATNLAANKAIVIDTTAPVINGVSSNHADGTFSDPELIDIDVTFSEPVTSNLVTVTLDSGGSCTFPISNSNFGTCDYIVQSGENSIDLDAFSISGTIKDQAQNTLTNFTPATNLAANKAIVIDTTPTGKPTIANVTSSHPNGSFKAGESINVDFTFSEPVNTTGYAAVTFNSGGSCAFTVSSSDRTSCSYLVQAGENSTDLNVSNVSGIIKDLAQNQMTNFTLSSNLAESSDIVIDTTAPLAPSITLLDPITDSNKSQVTITGTGEANASVSYSIDDINSATSTVTGTGSVGSNGAIIVNGINLGSLDGGTITASMTLTDLAGNESATGEDMATSQIVKPTITNVTSDHADGTFHAREVINVELTFSELVTSTGDVSVTFDSGGSCTFSVTDSDTASCEYTVQTGENSFDLNVSNISGTIRDQAGNAMINFVPTLNLANNKDIVVDTTAVILNSFTSTTSDNIYGPGSKINITANYSENVVNGSITIILNTGTEITLDTITGGKTITGTYTVGATGSNENTSDLAISSISSQTVCDINTKCVTDTLLPNTNISSTSDIVVDTVAPDFFDILPANSSNIQSVTTNSNISFSLSENISSGSITITRTAWLADPGSPHVCILQGAALLQGEHIVFDTADCQGGAIDLVPGAVYKFLFQGEDLYGNASKEDEITGVSFGIDNSAPVISGVATSNSTSSSIVITWTTSELSNSLVDFGTDTTYGKTLGNSNESKMEHSVTIDNLEPGTEYKFRVRSADSENNSSIDDNGGAGYDFVTPFLATISNMNVGEITSSSATVTWNSDSAAYSYIYYGTTEDYGMIIGKEETLTENHSITIAGLSPNTKYYFRARTKDLNGNFSLGTESEFTTLDGTASDALDTTPPTISGAKVSKGLNSSMLVSWKTNKICNGMVRYGLDKNYGQSMAEDATIYSTGKFSSNHEVALDNLLSNTTYYYSIVSYDSSGNIAVSSDKTFKTDALSTVSSVKVTDVTLNSATIVWETGDPTTSEVEFGLTTEYGQQKANVQKTNMHKIELIGLAASKTYHFRVRGENKDNNSVFSDDYIFATNDKPEIRDKSIGEVTDSRVTLKWTTNVETDSQVEYLNKNDPTDKGTQGLPDLAVEHNLTIEGLNQGSEYEIKIKGTDANKISFESEVFSVTTLIDKTAPEISQINSQASFISNKDEKVQSIISWKTDEAATSQVVFDTKKDSNNGDTLQKSMEDENLSTNHVVVLTNLKSAAVYYFRVISKDKNSNTSESEEFSLLTPRKQKSVIQLIISNFEDTFGWMQKMKL